MALRFTCFRILGSATPCLKSVKPASVVGVRFISGKNLYVPDPNKPKPFDYRKNGYNVFWQIIDKTTLRLDENSKVIIVEGAHAIGKSKFAEDLAEELNMVYVRNPRMDDLYVNPYGFDVRKLEKFLPDVMKPFDEKDFSRNPMGTIPGSCDRFMMQLYRLKYWNYLFSLRHLLNTGQGIVMESSPFSDYAYFEAAFNQGWIHHETRKTYKDALNLSLWHLLKPNLIIYLDAPVEVVQKNIEARGNEWDKKSPVWTNKDYLNDIYNELKRNWLKKMQQHSRVLVYDWSQPGDAEIVVEDIENLEFDNIDYYDDQQKDWRFHNEELASMERYKYTNKYWLKERLEALNHVEALKAEYLHYSPEEMIMWDDIRYWTESYRFHYGFNSKLGDSGFWWKESNYYNFNNRILFPPAGIRPVRQWEPMGSDDIDGIDLEDIKAIKAGAPSYDHHNRKVLGY